jgi:hypothetical protein
MFAQVQQEVSRGTSGSALLQPSIPQELNVALANIGVNHSGLVIGKCIKTAIAKYEQKYRERIRLINEFFFLFSKLT